MSAGCACGGGSKAAQSSSSRHSRARAGPTICGRRPVSSYSCSREAASAYVEFNLSPSERWAAYDFSSYREGMAERPFPHEPTCSIRAGQDMAIFDAAIPVAGLPDVTCDMGLSAVIEEEGGRLSYWALSPRRGEAGFPRSRLLCRQCLSQRSAHEIRYRSPAGRAGTARAAGGQARGADRASRFGHRRT